MKARLTHIFLSYQFRYSTILPVILVIINLCFVSCKVQNSASTSLTELSQLINSGELNKVETIINSELKQKKITETEIYSLDSLLEICRRIRIDFNLDESQVKASLSKYFPELDSITIQHWENSHKLEMRIIDGEKRYFKNSARNLFRLDKEANLKKVEIEGIEVDSLKIFCLKNSEKVITNSKGIGTPCLPVKMRLHYSIKLKPNSVPEGKIVKCWMPFPQENNIRQKGVKLISSYPEQYVLSPKENLQRTIYLEQKAVKDEWIVFETELEFESYSQHFNIKPNDIKEYNKQSKIYIENTIQQKPHILFTENIKKLSSQIVGNETNPALKVQKIYEWISDSIPWASALEYSIIPNIPEYVIKYRHGDCGMKTLLFMTLARYEGIPVKWQSGWMLHPGEVNLHDWCEVFFEGIGWIPLDQSFGLQNSTNDTIKRFYASGIDSYRFIVNDAISTQLSPKKKFLRSEPYDFQRGELEWEGGNIYFDKWNWNMKVEYIFQEK